MAIWLASIASSARENKWRRRQLGRREGREEAATAIPSVRPPPRYKEEEEEVGDLLSEEGSIEEVVAE